VLEASALQDDLRRAQIEPFAWVINGSLAAAQPRDPVLRARAAAEIPQIRKVKELLALRVALITFQAEEPVGVERLNSLAAWRSILLLASDELSASTIRQRHSRCSPLQARR
jgi:arsenite-transporting ATPase